MIRNIIICCCVIAVQCEEFSDFNFNTSRLAKYSSFVNISSADPAMVSIRAIILGAPGSGKGTISEKIRKNFIINYISSGDILRTNIANKTELGKKIESQVSSGQLVSDDVMNDLIKSELNKTSLPWLLDGYPRTLPQAEKLSRDFDINLVLNLVVPFEVIIERLKSRWIHLPSGRVYNIGFNDPKTPGFDDITNEPLTQREDDKPDVVKKRLDTYSATINPVIDFYSKKNDVLHTFKGNTSKEIWSELSQFLLKKIKLIDPN
ncbi:GTP:AMP phosphotransferase AK3, mitochondrial isoform X1 [Planococcus citri]|uniref:GTP:AMP phosphotransferase AK3, mitochondrial isoform X1 n=2 Tax=Planococcus citri TaxID=170843 RepID=UPI0031F99799